MSEIKRGTLVYVSDFGKKEAVLSGATRIYIAPRPDGGHYCVTKGDEGHFINENASYCETLWNYVVPFNECPFVEDPVNNPSHYQFRGGVETIDFLSRHDFSGVVWNVCKYIYRYPKKGGVEALRKIEKYLHKRLEYHPDKGEIIATITPLKLADIIEYCVSNKFSVLEAKVVVFACLGQYWNALQTLESLIAEVETDENC